MKGFRLMAMMLALLMISPIASAEVYVVDKDGRSSILELDNARQRTIWSDLGNIFKPDQFAFVGTKGQIEQGECFEYTCAINIFRCVEQNDYLVSELIMPDGKFYNLFVAQYSGNNYMIGRCSGTTQLTQKFCTADSDQVGKYKLMGGFYGTYNGPGTQANAKGECTVAFDVTQKTVDPPVIVDPPKTDSDGDGLMDTIDLCPMIWAQTPTGCPDPKITDSDGDGYEDSVDACPTEFGTDNGCPPDDGDNDIWLYLGGAVGVFAIIFIFVVIVVIIKKRKK